MRLWLALVVVAVTVIAAPAGAAQDAVAHARLEGEFTITTTVTSVGEGVSGVAVGDVATRDLEFTPVCASGPCDVTIAAAYSEGRVTLARNRARYRGTEMGGHEGVCGGRPVIPFVAYDLRITQARHGLATRVTGTWSDLQSYMGDCAAAETSPMITYEVVAERAGGPVEPNRPPVATPDVHAAEAGKELVLDAPGILDNDEDPDGDAIIAVHVSHVSSVAALVRFRPDGSLAVAPEGDASGLVCIEYRARDARGAESDPATILVDVGGATDVSDPADAAGACAGVTPLDRNEYSFELEIVEDQLGLDGQAASVRAEPTVTLAAAGVGASARRFLTGHYGERWFNCNSNYVQAGLSRFYGSMTGWVWATRSDRRVTHVDMRYRVMQSGQLVYLSDWTQKRFFDGVAQGKLHVRFGSPGETFTFGWQVRWRRHRAGKEDEVLGAGPFFNMPYSCSSFGSYEY